MICQEAERLQALRHLRLLDTAPSEGFDRITRMAAQIFGLPIAAVSLTDHDRQWFKSKVGIQHNAIPRMTAPCSEVSEETKVLVIPDFLQDAVYSDSPLASSGVRFYAGAPLVTREGYGLGALCVLGSEPRSITPDETAALVDLAAMVMSQIELQHAYGRVDPISGLANRHQFLEDLQDLALVGEVQRRFVVLVDVGRTDQVAELTRAHGSAAVDSVITETARRLERALGTARTVYHVGSTQFAFLAPFGVTAEEYAIVLTQHLLNVRSSVETRFVMTPVIGVVPFVTGETNPQDVLRMAFSGTVFGAAAVPEPEPLVPAVPVKKSVTNDYIVCLEDGKSFKSLKRHLMTHYDLTPEEYRTKWNLPKDYPMVAPNYAAARSALAKTMGLGRKPGVAAPAAAAKAAKARSSKKVQEAAE